MSQPQLTRQEMREITLSLEEGTERTVMLIIRLLTLALIVSLLTMHVRSLRVFRWEQSVTGGILVTYCVAAVGLAICAGAERCGGVAFQAFMCGTGAALFATNAAIMWRRWKKAGELTRIIAELLITLGMQLKRQVRWKIGMSALVALLFLIDMALSPLLPRSRKMILFSNLYSFVKPFNSTEE